MYYKRTLEEVKRELERRAEKSTAAAAAWEAVTIKRKKDGGEYKHLAAAVEGARVQPDIIGNTEIAICFKAGGRYEVESLSIYGYCDELPEDDPRHKKPDGGCWRIKYDFTAAEVEQKIKNHIEYLRSYAAECQTDAARAAELGKEYRDAIQAAEDKLTAATDHYKKQPDGRIHTSSLFWLLTETR